MILVAEDDPVVQKVLSAQLKELGFKSFLVVGNGRDAVDHACKSCIVLMDLNMPVMDGLTATGKIRNQESAEGKSKQPIIAVTGVGDRSTCLAAGMTDYMQKPIRLEDLKRTISKWLPDHCDCCA